MRCALLIVLLGLLAGPGVGQLQAQHHAPPPPAPEAPADPHAGHHGHGAEEEQALPPFIPPLTDADRAAAFPDLDAHHLHGTSINSFVLADHLEWRQGPGPGVFSLDTTGWVGQDIDRLWFRAEGEVSEGAVEHANVQVFYGRAIRRWWDVVAGIRQDMGAGPNRTWAAVGIQGLAPYWFEVEATAYVGPTGRTAARFEVEYDLLITNRLILQPVATLDVYGRDDPALGIGRGVSSGESGIRLRYVVRRELAPYVGVTWDHKFFGTADAARRAGEPVRRMRLVTGVRLWF